MAAPASPPPNPTPAAVPPGAAPPAATSPAAFAITPQLARIIAALLVGGLAAIFDSTIVAIGLPTLVTSLHTNVATIQWVSTGYLLSLAVAIPLISWGEARIGGKRLWLFALALFMVGSILCSLAWNPASLIAFRVVQGIGGGLLMPLMQSLLIQAAGPAATGGAGMGKLMATVSLPIALGPIVGPVIGGVILHWLDWPWLFWVNVPVCLVGIVLGVLWLPRDRRPAHPPRFDIRGFAMLAPALVGLLYGLSNTHAEGGFGRTDVWLPMAAGLLLLVSFVFYATRRGEGALVDVRLFRRGVVARASGIMFFTGTALFGAMLLLPLYFENVRGFTVLTAAFYLIPQGVGSLLSRTLAGRAMDRIGARGVAVVGFVIVVVGTLPFSFAGGSTPVWLLLLSLLVRGIGLGAVLIPVIGVAYLGLQRTDVPHASVITRIAQQLGGSFGTAILAAVLQAGTVHAVAQSDLAGGFRTAFWWATGFSAIAVVLSLLLPGRQGVAVTGPAPGPEPGSKPSTGGGAKKVAASS